MSRDQVGNEREEQLKQMRFCICRGCGCPACGGLYWLTLADAIRWNMITEEEAINAGLLSPKPKTENGPLNA